MNSIRSFTRLAILFMVTAWAGATASAQQATEEPPPLSAPAEGEALKLIDEMQQIQQRLMAAQQRALETEPELQERAQQYQQTLLEQMRAQGFDPMQSLSHIELIQQQIQDETLNDQEREGLIAEAQEEEARLQQAEAVALQDPKVRQEREGLMDAMLVAMRRQEPETDQLIQSLEDKNNQLREIMTAGLEESE